MTEPVNAPIHSVWCVCPWCSQWRDEQKAIQSHECIHCGQSCECEGNNPEECVGCFDCEKHI